MIIFKTFRNLNSTLQHLKKQGKSIGFVPTMGALHEGHLSLLDLAAKHNDYTVCSIFVNPAQFNNREDFEKYPLTVSHDIQLLEEKGCHFLFLPSESEVYPNGSPGQKHFRLGNIERVLEGEYRPGHFQGVCLVMEKLLSNIKPDDLFMGRKDFQQCMVVKKLLQLERLDTTLHTAPTVRESDGLAKSSRNLRLSPAERSIAPLIYKELKKIKENISVKNFNDLRAEAVAALEKNGFKIDYLSLATAKDLQSTDHYMEKEEYVLLIAAYLGNIRLIDNVLI